MSRDRRAVLLKLKKCSAKLKSASEAALLMAIQYKHENAHSF